MIILFIKPKEKVVIYHNSGDELFTFVLNHDLVKKIVMTYHQPRCPIFLNPTIWNYYDFTA